MPSGEARAPCIAASGHLNASLQTLHAPLRRCTALDAELRPIDAGSADLDSSVTPDREAENETPASTLINGYLGLLIAHRRHSSSTHAAPILCNYLIIPESKSKRPLILDPIPNSVTEKRRR